MWRKREQKRAEQIKANDAKIAAFWARVDAKREAAAAAEAQLDENQHDTDDNA